MSRKKSKIENEEKDARFRRVVEPRILKMIYQVERITDMSKSQTYKIFDTDAQKILDTVLPIIDKFVETYRNITTNTKPLIEEKEKLKHIF